jgi:hypothetical protein
MFNTNLYVVNSNGKCEEKSVKKKTKLTFSCDRKCIFFSVLRLTQMINVKGFKDRRYSLVPV